MKLPRLIKQIGKRVVKAAPLLRRHILPSSDYRMLDGADEARSAISTFGGWMSARTAARQDRAYRGLIAAMKRGEPRLDFQVAAEAVAATGIANPRLIEVGCGSGYYSEVFATLMAGNVRYAGVDYSDAMISRARARYPSAIFEIGDATQLPYADNSFDIVFNGVSLMHIIDYRSAIREAARVAAHYCVLHSVPVFDDHRTVYLAKYAYGAPVVEIVFGKQELLSICSAAGLHLIREWAGIPYDVHEATGGYHSRSATYLFAVDPDSNQSGAITVRT